MRSLPIGESAVALCVDGAASQATSDRMRAMSAAVANAALPGMDDIVSSPGRVTVSADPLRIGDAAAFRAAVVAAAERALEADPAPAATHEIPVAYDGPDLDDLCGRHGIARDAFIALHAEPDYRVEAVGFLPGFGYLGGLPQRLATPRRATPRTRVPAGSVGIGGGQTGVYPFASPGGWNLIGRSPVRLFDVTRPRPSLLAAGDRVRFIEADVAPADESPSPVGSTWTNGRRVSITVVHPGLFTTVQDLGRRGHRGSGVPLSGAADAVAMRLANLLVGNPPDAAGLECTLLGPTLRFERDAIVALVGGEFPGLPSGRTVSLTAGSEITFGHSTAGCRGCLAIAGGIDVEPVLGSRSTLVAAGIGGFAGRALAAGDRLPVGEPTGSPMRVDLRGSVVASARRPCVLRVIPGEHAEACGSIWSRTFRASSRSDRMGLRLDGEPVVAAGDFGGMASVAVFPGTVQLPPDGRPIVLLADAQTVGGYPVAGHVIAADLPLAAQLRPGDEVRMQPVGIDEAVAAVRGREATLADLAEGRR